MAAARGFGGDVMLRNSIYGATLAVLATLIATPAPAPTAHRWSKGECTHAGCPTRKHKPYYGQATSAGGAYRPGESDTDLQNQMSCTKALTQAKANCRAVLRKAEQLQESLADRTSGGSTQTPHPHHGRCGAHARCAQRP